MNISDPGLLNAALEGLLMQQARLEQQIADVRAALGGGATVTRARKSAGAKPAAAGKKRLLSPEARKRIAAAQKKRWAEYRKKQNGESA